MGGGSWLCRVASVSRVKKQMWPLFLLLKGIVPHLLIPHVHYVRNTVGYVSRLGGELRDRLEARKHL